jgi:hypothetical protein
MALKDAFLNQPHFCMARIVKSKVDALIGSKLSNGNVIVTDAWRAYKTYAV